MSDTGPARDSATAPESPGAAGGPGSQACGASGEPGSAQREVRTLGRAFPNLVLVDHPFIRHKVTLLRAADTPKKIFKELVDETAMLLAYEVTADIAVEPKPIATPLERTTGHHVVGERITLVPILRAGLGMVEGVLRLMPTMRVGHIGIERHHDTLEPIDYYFNIPADPEESEFIVADPMLATGGSASAAIGFLKRSGARRIRLMCLVAAPEGVQKMLDDHPDVTVYAAALDRQLDEDGYILPGLGDAGDRLYGT